MCTHLRRISNKYTGEDMFVKCGHCKACQMEKANKRKNRIQMEYNEDFVPLFVTLTYDRMSCPYVYLEDILSKRDILPVFRAHSTRIVPSKSIDGSIVYRNRRIYKEDHLFDVTWPDYNDVFKKKFYCLKKFGSRVGVVWYDDLKNFIKRLRINLERNFCYVDKFKFYSCAEYGPTTQRPHFHLLMFVRRRYEKIFRDAVVKSWPFAYRYRTEKYIQVAREAASYVATYVNCSTTIHPFLSKNFKVKHSYSKYFGFGNELFSLDSLLEMLGRRDMSYFVKTSGGQSKLSPIPLPKYVVNRYFPIFKGMSSLSDSAVRKFIFDPRQNASVTYFGCDDKLRPIAYLSETLLERVSAHADKHLLSRKFDTKLDDIHVPVTKSYFNRKISLSPEEVHKIAVRLDNAFEYYHAITGKSRIDFAYDYVDIWRCYKFTNFRIWRSDESICELYKFDNLIDLVNGIVNVPSYSDYFDSCLSSNVEYIIDPNKFPQNVAKEQSLTNLYDVKDKSRKVTNFVMSRNGHYV